MAGLSQACRSVFRWVIARLDEGSEVVQWAAFHAGVVHASLFKGTSLRAGSHFRAGRVCWQATWRLAGTTT